MILGILAIIASWVFQLPLEWAITLTVFGSIDIIANTVDLGITLNELSTRLKESKLK